MALEVVNGKLVVSYNFGFADGYRSSVVPNYNDVTKLKRALLIKLGIARNFNMLIVSANLE